MVGSAVNRLPLGQKVAKFTGWRFATAAMSEEKRIWPDTVLSHVNFRSTDELDVLLDSSRDQPQTPQEVLCHRFAVNAGKAIDRGNQRIVAGNDEAKRNGKLRAVPVDRGGLASECVKAGMVEIGGGKGRIPLRQPAPGAIVETLARNVHVVGIEHAVDETCGHVAGRHAGEPLDDLMKQDYPRLTPTRCVFGRQRAGIGFKTVVDQRGHHARVELGVRLDRQDVVADHQRRVLATGALGDHLRAGESLVVMGDLNDGPGLDEYENLFGRSSVEILLKDGGAPLYDPHAALALQRRLDAIGQHGEKVAG